ncbi:MAG: dockerin type I domain-containing protein [Minisyncoccia bacterium]
MNSSLYKIFTSFVTVVVVLTSVSAGVFINPKKAEAAGTTRYMRTTGSDSGNCVSSPCRTYAYASSQMASGDTLVIGDGVYEEIMRNPPNGTPGAYTTIKAENDFGVTFSVKNLGDWKHALNFYQSKYVVVQGIKFQGNASGVGGSAISLGGTDHIKLQRIAAWDASCVDNTAAIGIGGDYTLLEDVHVWGCGRYKVLVFWANHTVLRRVVSRFDFHVCAPDWGRQSSPFTVYDSNNTVFENSIAIDSGINDDVNPQCNTLFGGIWWENHGDAEFNGTYERTAAVYGSMFINNYSMANALNAHGRNPVGIQARYKLADSLTKHIERDNVHWDIQAGASYGIWSDYADRMGNPSFDVQHNTYGDINGTYYPDNGFTLGVGIGNYCFAPNGSCGSTFSSMRFANSLITQANSYGNVGQPGNYNNYWNNGSGGNSHYLATSPGANDKYLNPGMKYITRIESSSPLKGAASDGGDIGANIMYRYGVDSTMWGEPGYDTLTSVPLWPFPYENIIKQNMSSYNCAPTCNNSPHPSAIRGFTAPGNGLYGGPRTLTSYIWEYLGNPCPVGICNGSGPYPTPTPTPTPTGTPLLGDINLDRIVNSLDWSLMSSNWLTNHAASDLNKDGVVNSLDWSLMSSNWLKTS